MLQPSVLPISVTTHKPRSHSWILLFLLSTFNNKAHNATFKIISRPPTVHHLYSHYVALGLTVILLQGTSKWSSCFKTCPPWSFLYVPVRLIILNENRVTPLHKTVEYLSVVFGTKSKISMPCRDFHDHAFIPFSSLSLCRSLTCFPPLNSLDFR